MLRTRVMPCLLIQDRRLVKTVRFRNPQYVGDPVNAIKIYNEKEVDELIVLDIAASIHHRKPDLEIVTDITNECFMPVTYGGGITTIEEMQKIFNLGVEKIAINNTGVRDTTFFSRAAAEFGNQSVVASIDVKKTLLGKYAVATLSGKQVTSIKPDDYARSVEQAGAGEILLYSMDRDGTWSGFDCDLIRMVSSQVSVPVIACGGAGKVEDFKIAVQSGASAVAIGSMAVFQGKNKGVLIRFPAREEIDGILHDCPEDAD